MLKKSVVIAGRHQTSISLEAEFFDELAEIANQKKCSLNALISEIDRNRNDSTNLSSAIRLYILHYLKNKCESGE